MENKALRELAGAYARRKITRAQYLESRSRLIQGITAADPAAPPSPEGPAPSTAAPASGGRHFRIDAVAAIATLLGLALGLYWYLQPAPRDVAPTRIAPVSTPAGARLLERFRKTHDWQPATERRLLRDWEELSEAARDQARASPAYRQFRNALYQAVLEEQALAELDDGAGDYGHLRSLLDLAGGLGVEDRHLGEVRVWLEQQRARASPPPANTEAHGAATPPAAPASTPSRAGPGPRRSGGPGAVPATTAPATRSDTGAGNPQATPVRGGPRNATIPPRPASDVTPARTPEPPPAPAPATLATGTTPAPVARDSSTRRRSRRHACVAELARTRKPYCRDGIKGDGGGPLMVVLPAGGFTMGGDRPEEQPRHVVRLKSAFAMSLHEISQQQFARFCASTQRACPPQPWSGKDLPVVNVSWHDARAYCQWLSRRTGHHYRLPLEVEWEYAARAGTRGRYPGGEDLLPTQARFSYQKTVDRPLPRGDRSVNRNRFRLYHMLGNVREWVLDGWHDNYRGAPDTARIFSGGDDRRVVRGGSYHDRAEALTLASRIPKQPDARDRYTGFRIVRPFTGQQGQDRIREGQAWLASQRADGLTLQVFAGRNIRTMTGLIDKYREWDIHVLPAASSDVNYRVIYGIFADRQQARNAYTRLPEEIRRLAGRPIIKSVADLRAGR